MQQKIFLLAAIIGLLSTGLFAQLGSNPKQNRYVVVISMDGFRHDYDDRANTPTLDSLARVGVRCERFVPAFPSLTFPNHYTLATGLYPNNHGIVHNQFYDAALDKTYSIGDRTAVENPAFYGGEPIWITAEKQDIITASYFWVGSEAAIQGMLPSYWHKYQQNIPFKQRADSVIAWLSKPADKRPHLIMWYWHEPDGTGHDAGPESDEIVPLIESLDRELGLFLKRMNRLPFASQIDFLLVSDHGMQEVDAEKKVRFIEDYIKESWVERVTGYNPVMNIDCKTGYEDSVYQNLARGDHFKVFRKGEFPESWHYGTNPRELEITVVADSGWVFRSKSKSYDTHGAHGYDPRNSNMHAILYAAGPSFKKNFTIPMLETVDLYGIICRSLSLIPQKTDGKAERYNDMFLISLPPSLR